MKLKLSIANFGILAALFSSFSASASLTHSFGNLADDTIFVSEPDASQLDEFEKIENDDSCSDVNLYEKSSALNEVPIYEQGETYLCYAYTVSQMTEYSLRKNGSWGSLFGADQHLDAIWTALSYKTGSGAGLRFRKQKLGEGYFKTAWKDLEKRGICDPAVYEASMDVLKRKSVLSTPDYLYLFEELWNMRAKNTSTIENIDTLLGREDLQRMEKRIFPREGAAGLKPELLRIRDQVNSIPSEWFDGKHTQTGYFENVVLNACSGSAVKPVNLPQVRTMGLGYASNRKLKRAIDEALDAPDADPLTIGYCSGLYHEPERAEQAGKRKALLPRFIRVLSEKNCSTHYSLVVGRRRSPVSGKCEYLIRNTMGKDFWPENPSVSCLCEKKDQAGYEVCTDPASSKGRVVGCYLEETPLLNSVYDLAFMERD